MTGRRGSEAMRVAVVAPPWFEVPPSGYGGIERVCFDLVEGLVARGHEITIVAAGENRTGARFVPALPEPAWGLGSVYAPVQEVRYAARVGRALREAGDAFELVHDHTLAGPLLAGGRRVPTLITAHGPMTTPIGDYFDALRLPLVAISETQRRSAPRLPWIATIHNGVSVDAFPFRDEKDDFVLFLARISPEKGAHLAPDACRAAGFPLKVAAKCEEPEEIRYFDEEVRPRLGDGATWLGEVEGAAKFDLLSRARCLLLPVQWDEPFGLVVIEALACGTPVVALARGAMPELVEHGRTGWICDEVSELAAAIRRASEIDPRTCRAEAERRFGTTTMVESYEVVYRRLIATASA